MLVSFSVCEALMKCWLSWCGEEEKAPTSLIAANNVFSSNKERVWGGKKNIKDSFQLKRPQRGKAH